MAHQPDDIPAVSIKSEETGAVNLPDDISTVRIKSEGIDGLCETEDTSVRIKCEYQINEIPTETISCQDADEAAQIDDVLMLKEHYSAEEQNSDVALSTNLLVTNGTMSAVIFRREGEPFEAAGQGHGLGADGGGSYTLSSFPVLDENALETDSPDTSDSSFETSFSIFRVDGTAEETLVDVTDGQAAQESGSKSTRPAGTGFKRPRECAVCNKTFAYPSQLKTHQATHREGDNKDTIRKRRRRTPKTPVDQVSDNQGEQNTKRGPKPSKKKPLECTLCGKQFPYPSYLRIHMVSHQDDKPFECPTCGKRFVWEQTLKRHQTVHTKERNHKCEICEQTFAYSASLSRHMGAHSGQSYACEVCGKRFTQASSIRHHMVVHTGEKPYSCEVCGRAFNTTSNLRRHSITHTGLKRFQCEICEKSFGLRFALSRHIELVHLSH